MCSVPIIGLITWWLLRKEDVGIPLTAIPGEGAELKLPSADFWEMLHSLKKQRTTLLRWCSVRAVVCMHCCYSTAAVPVGQGCAELRSEVPIRGSSLTVEPGRHCHRSSCVLPYCCVGSQSPPSQFLYHSMALLRRFSWRTEKLPFLGVSSAHFC